MKDSEGKLGGHCRRSGVAHDLGLRFKLQEMAIPDLVAGLQQGKLIAVVAATASADRELLMEFSHPYYSPSFDNAECRLTKQDIESCLV